MSYKTPQQIAAAAVISGTSKANLSVSKALVGGFLAGAYIAFGALVAISVSSGLTPDRWGTLSTLFTGALFSLGLILVVIAGGELLTGNMALLPMAFLRKKITLSQLGINFGLVLVANFAGSIFVAYFLAYKTGVIGETASAVGNAGLEHTRAAALATGKAHTETDYQIFLRAVGCNWLVALAVWLGISAEDVAGKILGIFFPITAFVALGFDHVVANMFFLPLGIFIHAPGVTWGSTFNNLWIALLGNLVGAGFFVGFLYWFLYLRDTDDVVAGDPAGTAAAGPGQAPAATTR